MSTPAPGWSGCYRLESPFQAQHSTAHLQTESRWKKISLAGKEDTPGTVNKASPSAPLPEHFLENSVSHCSAIQVRIIKESRILLFGLLILRPSGLWPLLGPTYLMYAPSLIWSFSPWSFVFWVLTSWFIILEHSFESWNSLEALARTSSTAPILRVCSVTSHPWGHGPFIVSSSTSQGPESENSPLCQEEMLHCFLLFLYCKCSE